MKNHEDVKKNEEERLKQDWRSNVKIADAYAEFKDEFIDIVSAFESM